MNQIKDYMEYFTKEERLLWGCSVTVILLSFCIFDRENYLTLSASLIGVTSLIFNAKDNRISKKEVVFMWILATVVTVAFYFILAYFKTANIVPSTLSVTTSFVAVYLTFRRNPYFAVAYAANDVVLIVLWVLASMTDIRYVSVAVCFVAFFVNDVYGYLSWKKMERRQSDCL